MYRFFVPLFLFCAMLLVAPLTAKASSVKWTIADGGNDHWYEVVDTLVFWDQAFADAPTRIAPVGYKPGHLVTISDAAENTFLAIQFSATNSPAWAGFTDSAVEGEWRWIDDTTGIWQDPDNFPNPIQTAYTNWAPGEPNDYYPIGEDYMIFNLDLGDRQGMWNDGVGPGSYLANPYPYVVEYDPIPEPSTLVLGALGGLALLSIRRRRFRQLLVGIVSTIALVTTSGEIHAETIAWANWTTATPSIPTGGSAVGQISLPAVALSVHYEGELTTNTLVGQGPAPQSGVSDAPNWGPSSTYSGGTVDNAPSPADSLGLNGGLGTSINTVTFGMPVSDPVMAIWSLGNATDLRGSFVFSSTEPFTIEAGGPSTEYGGSSIFTDLSAPNTVFGNEGNGTIQFHGTFTSLSWTNPINEGWYGFTIGVPVPEPSTLVLGALGGLALLTLRRRRFR